MMGDLRNWFSVAALAVSLATTIYAFLTSKAKANAEHLKSVDKSLTDLDRRVQSVEAEQKHMPSKDDVNQLKLDIAEMKGAMQALDGEVKGVSRTIRRVEDYLMKEGK